MKPVCTAFVSVCMLAAAANAAANEWVKVTEGKTGRCCGAVLAAIDRGRAMLLFGGEATGGAVVRAFDPKQRTWRDFAVAKPKAKRGIHPYYQTAFDPKARKLYCLSYPGVLYTFDVAAGKWAGPHAGGVSLQHPYDRVQAAGRDSGAREGTVRACVR